LLKLKKSFSIQLFNHNVSFSLALVIESKSSSDNSRCLAWRLPLILVNNTITCHETQVSGVAPGDSKSTKTPLEERVATHRHGESLTLATVR
jgi:hypothetical protein